MPTKGPIYFISTNIILLVSLYLVYFYSINKFFANKYKNNSLTNFGFFLLISYSILFLLTYTSYIRACFTEPGFMK